MSKSILKHCLNLKGSSFILIRSLSSVSSERKADFFPRVISENSFPDTQTLKLKRGTGYRSSFNGQIVTVFGCTGFLARSVVFGLGKIGSQIICPYRGEASAAKHLKLAGDLGQILYTPYYLRDIDSLYRAMKYSNVVINLIGRDHETSNFDFESIYVEGPRTIARIARELGVKRFIHVSALNSTPNPKPYWIKGGSKFMKTKYYGELAVREEFPETIIFRPADMYGEADSFLLHYASPFRRQLRKLGLTNGGYDIIKSPVLVSDVARGIINSITDESATGQTFDCVGPRRYEFRRLMLYLQDCLGKQEDCGFAVTNLAWDIEMRLRLSIFTRFNGLFKKARISWEKVERESFSDEKPKNFTLEDLGVHLSYLEDHWPHFLEPMRWDGFYDGDLGESRVFEKPKYIMD